MKLDRTKTLQRVRLNGRRAATQTRWHRPRYNGAAPAELEIVPCADEGFALLYLDGQHNELGQSTHRTLGLAIGEAEWSFAVAPRDWEVLSASRPLAAAA